MSYFDKPNAEISEIANGWKLELSWEAKDEKGATDWKNEEWMFSTWEEAIEKASQFFKDQEPKVGEQTADSVL